MNLLGKEIRSLGDQREFNQVMEKDADKKAKDIQSRLPKLIKTLKDGNEYTREEAASELGSSRDPRAVEPLMMILEDKSSPRRVRGSALGALNTLIANRHKNAEVQQLTDTKIVPEIKKLIHDQKIWDKKDYNFISGLTQSLYSAGDNESYEISERLSEHKPNILKMFGAWDNDQYPAVYKIDPQAKPIMTRALRSNNENLKFQAVELMNIAGYKDEVFDTIVEIVRYGKELEYRQKCLMMLDKIGDIKSKEIIEEAANIKELKATADFILEWWNKKHGKQN